MSSTVPIESIHPTRRDFLRIIRNAGVALFLSACQIPHKTEAIPTIPNLQQPPTSTGMENVETQVTTTPPAQTLPAEHSLTLQSLGDTLPSDPGVMTKVILPEARETLSLPLNETLQNRRSSRSFKPDELPLSLLSAIFWAGFGINRPDGKRTAPSAYNAQDIDLYLVCHKGFFRYLPAEHALITLSSADLRQRTGSQAFVELAPVHIIYVADSNRLEASVDDKLHWSWAHTGLIVQNVYLACAALGLSTVVRSTLDRTSLASHMGLTANQKITLAQTIGFPV